MTVLGLFAEYVDELKRCGPTYSLWAALEEDLAEPLRGVAGCVERCCMETEEHIQYLSEVLVPAVHEYVLCADTVKVSEERGSGPHQNPNRPPVELDPTEVPSLHVLLC